MSDISDAPVPRQCHIIMWPDFQGYGFNLHSEKNRPGQFIGKVDEDSPAEYGGLKKGDRILEVNGANISNENHKQVVQRIKQNPNETQLLVVDEEAEHYFKERGIVVRGNMDMVQKLVTPIPRPGTSLANGHVTESDEQESPSERSSLSSRGDHYKEKEVESPAEPPIAIAELTIEDPPEEEDDGMPNGLCVPDPDPHTDSDTDKIKDNFSASSQDDENLSTTSTERRTSPDELHAEVIEDDRLSPSPMPSPREDSSSTTSSTTEAEVRSHLSSTPGLNLQMSAAEMRERLSKRKKKDPRVDNIDFRRKYEIIQSM